MKLAYKLTNKDGQTHGGCQWGENVTHRVSERGKKLCSSQVIHYYESPLLAVFANPIHANFPEETMQLWEFLPKRKIAGDTLKSACKEGTTIRRIPVPKMSLEQRVEIAIRCSLLVYREKSYVEWANNWLLGKDRSTHAAYAAHASAAAYSAAYAAYAAAAYAAYAAAAYSAAYAAYAAAAYSAAAYSAAYAAYSAAHAADTSILTIINKVMGIVQ